MNSTSAQQPVPPGRNAGLREGARFRRDPLGELTRLAAEFGPVARLTFGSRNVVLLSEPELIRQMVIVDDWNFTKGQALQRSRRLLGDGLLTSEGELHRRQRRLMQPAFSHDHLRGYAETMVRCSLGVTGRWQNGATLDMHAEMMRLTLDIVSGALFGASVDNEAAEVSASVNAILGLFRVMATPLQEMLEKLRTPRVRRFERARDHLNATVYRLIEARRKKPGSHDDLLSILVGSHDDGESATMSDVLLRDEVMTLFLAGHETTANALTFTWWLLAQHPEAEQQLHAELDNVLAGRTPAVEDYAKLAFTRQIISESLRLYPPAWGIGRNVVTDYSIGGYYVPAGTLLICSQWVTHRDLRFYERPLQFDPSRWEPEKAAARPKFSYFPFGAGTRVCIGEHFAWMEAVLALATIAQHWRPKLASTSPAELKLLPGITLRPIGGVTMTLEQR